MLLYKCLQMGQYLEGIRLASEIWYVAYRPEVVRIGAKDLFQKSVLPELRIVTGIIKAQFPMEFEATRTLFLNQGNRTTF